MNARTSRIALIHATRAAVQPVEAAFADLWPEAQHWSLLDEGLTQEVDRQGGLTDKISERFIRLAEYAANQGIDGLLFTCTAFGPPMEVCQQRFAFPTLKPNEAMLETALETGDTIGLVATHPVTLPMLTEQLERLARTADRSITVRPAMAAGAWEALHAGDQSAHDRAVVEAAKGLEDCDCIALAQFSMAPLADAIAASVSPPILTAPHAAVTALRDKIGRQK
ncbi:MAG: arylsulfatase [Rhodospirillaceae bacterium]|jgi:Asp/Glu/hydantoin racemase|nr:arylsulfatase [Rhodospirillaceae bacterium]